jgi:hypothetical protein
LPIDRNFSFIGFVLNLHLVSSATESAKGARIASSVDLDQ